MRDSFAFFNKLRFCGLVRVESAVCMEGLFFVIGRIFALAPVLENQLLRYAVRIGTAGSIWNYFYFCRKGQRSAR